MIGLGQYAHYKLPPVAGVLQGKLVRSCCRHLALCVLRIPAQRLLLPQCLTGQCQHGKACCCISKQLGHSC